MRVINYVKKHRNLLLKIIDILIIIACYIVAMFIIENRIFFRYPEIKQSFINSVLLAIIVYQVLFHIFSMYKNITTYESGKDYLIYISLSIICCSVILMLGVIFSLDIIDPRIHLFASLLIAMCIVAYRVFVRIMANEVVIYKDTKRSEKNNVLIIGAGSAARDIIKAIHKDMQNLYNVVGIIDDDKNKYNYAISGVRILGNRHQIIDICKEKDVGFIFFSISNISLKDKREILDMCQETGAKIRILPSTTDIIKNNKNIMEELRDVEIEDILGRDPIVLDNKNIENLIKDNTVLVTGGGGSIGSELCRQIIKYKPKKLVIFDIYENNLYDIEIELKSEYKNIEIDAVVGSIRDTKKVEELFKKYTPNLVFHAAAHKHVPLMENSPLEAIKNNVFGTYNIINASDKYNVENFVLVSTDKAVNPTNIMGATKRICEMIIQAKNKVSKTEFVAVRFGNVLGSNGSVVPLFKKQIAEGGPVTVTHKEITRFFMTIPEAVQLILQAATYANGGEIFVLDMGEPVKIYDLAVSLIKLSGLQPNIDIPIQITGLRPGEKLYEELLMNEEGLEKTAHNKIHVAEPLHITMQDIEKKLEKLQEIIDKENIENEEVKEIIEEIVPTYKEEKKEIL